MKITIIGNGMVGQRLCEKLVDLKMPNLSLSVFGEEPITAYDRVHLSEYFAGKSVKELCIKPMSWYKENNIQLYLGNPILEIDRDSQCVTALEGQIVYYDYLIIATGSAPFIPNMYGTDKSGVFMYRTIEDLNMIEKYAASCKTGVVIGGGLLGLEAAKALLDLGIKDIKIVEFSQRLMPRQIDNEGSDALKNKLKELGITTLNNKNTMAILGNESIHSLIFADGSTLSTDIAIISAGIKPRDELARKCGLDIGARGGIIVNDNMQTSDPNIYAIGECALHDNIIYGLVAPGYEMAEVVAQQLIKNKNKAFIGFDMSTKLKLIGVDVASFGDPFIDGNDAKCIVYNDTLSGTYKRINISNDGKYLLGGSLVGDTEEYNKLLQIFKNKMEVKGNPLHLIVKSDNSNANEGFELPDDALICSCEGVTKKDISDAVEIQGCENFDAVKKCTKAGTGCGGCVPMVKDIVNNSLKKQGKVIKKVICEHFQYSRQELYSLIQVKNIKSYDEALDTIGKGDGCEVCRPAVSSLLASIWNDLVVAKTHHASQDTNDRFLANIQKGGTYSVVPRIPGGEITPEKLMAIGTVAHKYNLYTKITGAQRVDMFGAHLNDLPYIWEELIAAGFESGHAYGKSLRAVKSCVGSTWCRFGLHDSVSFAIQIENRYKGIRAPHKLKGAVSGCVRECAEAQGKDFGIIATEKGWNLYVCGNGGAKPQHAQLIASDIDSETCIKYIDRFLMFYIKTADPLTRTAPWLNKLEGGINYLKEVIIHDSLGIAADLEAEIATLIETYQCEWKAAIENPEIRKRFSHFANAKDEKDPSITFAPMREQKKATNWG
ncbi:MAG TPA: nitrite reductase large subunit NirB [Chitinophagales bacterium]|nr:nitrite reductase large subunit NirB [Chitinophagales bacterium]HMW13216.1 nitrite reductase large subunit NirB [Chitinophagales bacterium]HMX60918.1 nitrite reductase large subunit NirB [Chitinophagales bacterium]HMZ34045.1 nitrite reductase large subunit NirB [Chitinophagales bacterium]HNB49620.1 nitrite reductase large subunit NirB [Chitinophagales bacterium]